MSTVIAISTQRLKSSKEIDKIVWHKKLLFAPLYALVEVYERNKIASEPYSHTSHDSFYYRANLFSLSAIVSEIARDR